MPPKFLFSLKLEPTLGLSLDDLSRDAQRIADLLGVCAEFDMNGTICMAIPGGDPKKLQREYAKTALSRLKYSITSS